MHALFARYLRLLGIDDRPRGLEGLNRLIDRHLCRVPFENVSKLVLLAREGRGRTTGLAEFLDGIEHHDLGGTCYTCNPFFAQLLRALGYDADLHGADMSEPDVHTAIRVRLEGREHHVDVGFGAPFRSALALDELPVQAGNYRVARGPEPDTVKVEGPAGYLAHGPARRRSFFRRAVMDSFQPGRHFLTLLRIVRFNQDGMLELTNHTLRRHTRAGVEERRLRGASELAAAVHNEFGMPRCPLAEALAMLERLTGRTYDEG